MLSTPAPLPKLASTAVRPAPVDVASPAAAQLPKLKVAPSPGVQHRAHPSTDDTRRGFHAAPPVLVQTSAPDSSGTIQGPTTRSPSSPSSFFSPDMKFGLSHLLEAAEQVRPPMTDISSPFGRVSPLKRAQPLPSINAMGGFSLEASSTAKRARIGSDVGLDVQASYSLLGHMPRQAMIYPSVPQQIPTPHQHQHQTVAYAPTIEVQSPSSAGSTSPLPTMRIVTEYSTSPVSRCDAPSVWDTVLTTGKFPSDVGLSENGVGQTSPTTSFIATNLSPPPDQDEEPVTPRESFNPLSLKSIMNNDSSSMPSLTSSDVSSMADTIANTNLIRQSPRNKPRALTKKSSQRVLKRSDYSQHGMVRSGRWSVEEENYAKAMIEAFKSGYLPLHGNVSLRKFLSEVLVCHPMRISKKFVGYVRKYHWYRIAAGKCDPEAKQQALQQLCHLERVFWTSLQQNSEWSASLRRDE